MKNAHYLLFIALATISCPGVSAGNRTWMCFVQNDNGTVGYTISKMCADGEYCCGKETLDCCRKEGSDTVDDSRWSDPYWVATLAFRISLLVLAIGTGVGYFYKKCSCSREPEHLVFVNHSIDADGTPIGPATNCDHPTNTPAMAGQSPAYTHQNMTTPYMVPTHMRVVNSFNPYNPKN